jgi:ABC-type dipeptide/oligopeptide/nickel transport system permease component
MGKYIVRRLLQMGLVLFGASLVLFTCLYVLPGDPVRTVAGGERVADPATRAALEKRYNLDQPLAVQYVRYVSDVARGDLGESFRLRRPVNDVIKEKIWNTARLALAAILFETIIGIVAGVIAAIFRYSFWDVLVTLTTTLAIGFPTFVIGLVFQDVFSMRFHLLPLSGNQGGTVQDCGDLQARHAQLDHPGGHLPGYLVWNAARRSTDHRVDLQLERHRQHSCHGDQRAGQPHRPRRVHVRRPDLRAGEPSG